MTLTFERDLENVTRYQQAKRLGQRPSISKAIARTPHRQTQTHTVWPIALPGPFPKVLSTADIS